MVKLANLTRSNKKALTPRLFQDFHVGHHVGQQLDHLADMMAKNGDLQPECDRAGMIAHLPPVPLTLDTWSQSGLNKRQRS